MASLRQRAEAKQKWLHGKEHRCLLDGGGITPDKVRGKSRTFDLIGRSAG